MSTVRAPYPSKMDTINGKSVVTMIRTPTTVTFKNRAGVSVGPFTIRNLLPTTYVQCLRRIGMFDTDNKDVLIKGWNRLGGTNSEIPFFPTKVRTNLIPNPSFEVDLAGWTFNASTTATRDATYHPSGSWAMKVVNGTGSPIATTPAISVIAGTTYRAMATILDSSGTPGPGIAKGILITWKNSGGGTISTDTIAPTVPISPVSIVATAPVGAITCTVSVFGGTAGTWYFDAILFEKYSIGIDSNYFDGASVNAGKTYGWSGTANNSTSVETPTNLPTTPAWKVAWSPDGKYLAALVGGTAGLLVFKRNWDSFTQLTAPAYTGVTGGQVALSWSHDGQYLFVGNAAASPKVVIFKRSGDVLTKLADPAYIPAGNVNNATWSSDGVYVAVGISVAPYVVFYKRSGDTFTKLSDPAALPPSAGNDVSFSPGTLYVAVVHTTAPYLTIYKRSGDTFTKLASGISAPPDAGCSVVSFAPNGRYLAVDNGSSVIAMYKRSGDSFARTASPADITGFAINGLAWTPDSNYLACLTNYNQPYYFLYKRTGDVLKMRNGLTTTPPGGVNWGKFSPDGKHLALACATTPFLSVYKSQMDPVAGVAIRLVADSES